MAFRFGKGRMAFGVTLLFIFGARAQSWDAVEAPGLLKEKEIWEQITPADAISQGPEQVLLQLASNQIMPQEPVFFKAYISTSVPSDQSVPSGVLLLDVLDDEGKLVKRQFHKIVNGTVHGQLELPKNTAMGNYTLKAYTRWSQNFGADHFAWATVKVGEVAQEEMEEDSQMTIFPEGGTLVNNYPNRILIKIPQPKILGQEEEGQILDGEGKEVAQVSFYTSQMGTAIFTPASGQHYYVQLNDGSRRELPEAKDTGYLLQVNNLDAETAKVHITAVGAESPQMNLVGSAGQKIVFQQELDFQGQQELDLELHKANFPRGAFTLGLVDALGEEWAKRPIWIEGQQLHMAIVPVPATKGIKTYKISVTDLENRPVQTQVALSATRYLSESPMAVSDQENQVSGTFDFYEETVPNATSNSRKQRFIQDLWVLASQGGLNTDTSSHKRFSPQKGLEIMGYAYDLNNNLLTDTKIQLAASNELGLWIGEAKTDTEGLLQVEDIQIEGEATLIARTAGEDTQSRLVKIVPLHMDQKKKVLLPYVEAKPEDTVKNTQTSPLEKSYEPAENTIMLDEVQVVEKEAKQKKYAPSVYGIEVSPSRVKYQNPERPKTLVQLLSEFPGMMVQGAETLNPTVKYVSGYGPILWVLDGFPLAQGGNEVQENSGFGNYASSSMSDIRALVMDRDIERVELLAGADASIYGSRGSGAVIVIYTRFGGELGHVARKEAGLVLEGYTAPMDFNAYKEQLSKKEVAQMELLYWNPSVETDAQGEATISFPETSDDTKIKVEASTVTGDGKIGAVAVVL